MSIAVANVLGVNAINVVLTFSASLDRRSQSTGVLVSAGITDVEQSPASYASRITQDKFNKEMAGMGLNYGQLTLLTGPGTGVFWILYLLLRYCIIYLVVVSHQIKLVAFLVLIARLTVIGVVLILLFT